MKVLPTFLVLVLLVLASATTSVLGQQAKHGLRRRTLLQEEPAAPEAADALPSGQLRRRLCTAEQRKRNHPNCKTDAKGNLIADGAVVDLSNVGDLNQQDSDNQSNDAPSKSKKKKKKKKDYDSEEENDKILAEQRKKNAIKEEKEIKRWDKHYKNNVMYNPELKKKKKKGRFNMIENYKRKKQNEQDQARQEIINNQQREIANYRMRKAENYESDEKATIYQLMRRRKNAYDEGDMRTVQQFDNQIDNAMKQFDNNLERKRLRKKKQEQAELKKQQELQELQGQYNKWENKFEAKRRKKLYRDFEDLQMKDGVYTAQARAEITTLELELEKAKKESTPRGGDDGLQAQYRAKMETKADRLEKELKEKYDNLERDMKKIKLQRKVKEMEGKVVGRVKDIVADKDVVGSVGQKLDTMLKNKIATDALGGNNVGNQNANNARRQSNSGDDVDVVAGGDTAGGPADTAGGPDDGAEGANQQQNQQQQQQNQQGWNEAGWGQEGMVNEAMNGGMNTPGQIDNAVAGADNNEMNNMMNNGVTPGGDNQAGDNGNDVGNDVDVVANGNQQNQQNQQNGGDFDISNLSADENGADSADMDNVVAAAQGGDSVDV